MIKYIVQEKESGQILKFIAKNKLGLSTRLFNKLKLNHHIYINDNIAYSNDRIKTGDIVSIDFDYNEEDNIEPQEASIEVLFEDDWYLAVNKPSGIVVHPCAFHPNGTLANYVKHYLNNNKKIRPVNRLDKDTSGIVIFAKNEFAQEVFNEIHDEVEKKYIAIVEGNFDKDKGIIDEPISRKEGSIIERHVDKVNGQKAITEYKVVKRIKISNIECSEIELTLRTGRTHQIRVHMAYINHPIIGDTLYNSKESSKLLNRQALHAYTLSFKHPIENRNVLIKANIPDDIKQLINK